MKVVFLDIDGVLNSHQSAKRGLHKGGLLTLDPEAVERLNRLVREVPEVKFVLSSTWRLYQCREDFDVFTAVGFEGEFVGRTPALRKELLGSPIVIQQIRGAEIAAWLEEHPEVERYVILDDDSDMGPLLRDLIQTCSWKGGLQDEHVEEAIRRLR